MVLLTDINARLPSVWTVITYTQIDTDKIYTTLDVLVTNTVSPLL